MAMRQITHTLNLPIINVSHDHYHYSFNFNSISLHQFTFSCNLQQQKKLLQNQKQPIERSHSAGFATIIESQKYLAYCDDSVV